MMGGVHFLFCKNVYWLESVFSKSKRKENIMENYDFNYQIDEFMLFCRTRQLREKTMTS